MSSSATGGGLHVKAISDASRNGVDRDSAATLGAQRDGFFALSPAGQSVSPAARSARRDDFLLAIQPAKQSASPQRWRGSRALVRHILRAEPRFLRELGLEYKSPPLRRPWRLARQVFVGTAIRYEDGPTSDTYITFREPRARWLVRTIALTGHFLVAQRGAIWAVAVSLYVVATFAVGVASERLVNNSYRLNLISAGTIGGLTLIWRLAGRRCKEYVLARSLKTGSGLALTQLSDQMQRLSVDMSRRYDLDSPLVSRDLVVGPAFLSDLREDYGDDEPPVELQPLLADRVRLQANRARRRSRRIQVLGEYGTHPHSYWAKETIAHAGRCRSWRQWPALAGLDLEGIERLSRRDPSGVLSRAIRSLDGARRELLAHEPEVRGVVLREW
jgi:hypothetical protein